MHVIIFKVLRNFVIQVDTWLHRFLGKKSALGAQSGKKNTHLNDRSSIPDGGLCNTQGRGGGGGAGKEILLSQE